jgi:hypothetical protein
MHQEPSNARQAFDDQVSRFQLLTNNEFDQLDQRNLDPIKATIRREI